MHGAPDLVELSLRCLPTCWNGGACPDTRVKSRVGGEGHTHVADVDIRGYFGNMPHDPLMKLVEERIGDGRLLGLIGKFLKRGCWKKGSAEKSGRGVISPLLANPYLNPPDWWKNGRDRHPVSDDLVLLTRGAPGVGTAGRVDGGCIPNAPARRTWGGLLTSTSRLPLPAAKGKLMRPVGPKSRRKLRMKRPTRRTNGRRLPPIIAVPNPKLRGRFDSFRQARATNTERWINGWEPDCVRSCRNVASEKAAADWTGAGPTATLRSTGCSAYNGLVWISWISDWQPVDRRSARTVGGGRKPMRRSCLYLTPRRARGTRHPRTVSNRTVSVCAASAPGA